ncbi:MAG: ABC transporter permease [Ferruginibacter sp.]
MIKIAGLSIGLSVCMLILLYIKDEISYDRFHQKQSQLFRIAQTWKMGQEAPVKLGITNPIMGETFKREIPEVKEFIRISEGRVTVKNGKDVFTEPLLFVDNNFLSTFTFPLATGTANTALSNSNSVILSEEVAKKYFGTSDIIGRVMQLKNNDVFDAFTITGVTKNTPQNSTIKFGMLLPFEYYKQHSENRQMDRWAGGSLNTFLLLPLNADTKLVEKKMAKVFYENAKGEIAEGEKQMGKAFKIQLSLQPLTDIHLSTAYGPANGLADGSSPVYSYILTCIALFILIIACINFINLAIAQSLKRSKEIGIRKVIGSTRNQLIKQFLTESFVVSFIAFVFAVFLTGIILPFFNELANKKLSFSYLKDAKLLIAYLLLLVVTSFISGFYPSLVLSGFQPVKVLYSKAKLMGKNYFTRGLIVLQFALAIFLIIGAFAIYSQLNFLSHKDLGYDSKNLVIIELPFGNQNNNIAERFVNELRHQPAIVSMALKNGGQSIMPVRVEGKQITIDYNKIDSAFLPTFKIPITSGRNFSPYYPSDSIQSTVVNETFVKEAGWTAKNAIGKSINFIEGTKKLTVIGVIKDYHFSSLKEKITPQLFAMDTSMRYGQVFVKIIPVNIPQTLSLLQSTYKKILPWFPYSYQFMEDINSHSYETESKWKQMISIASVLFIFISCIGLFGLVILSIEQRTKEIGIRKVLGAAVSKIIILISRDFILLISIAFFAAVPLAYLAITKWLQSFPYRINISWWIFALAGAIVIAIALITVCLQAFKSAMANPVKNLRTE